MSSSKRDLAHPTAPVPIACRTAHALNALLDGIVADDPRAKTRVLALAYALVAALTAIAAVLYRPSHWVAFAVSRVILLGGLSAFLWRRSSLRGYEPVLYLGVLPAGLFVWATEQDALPLEIRLAFAFVIPAVSGALYSRRIAVAASLCELAALAWFSFRDDSLAHACANLLGFTVVFAVIVGVVNGTSVRLRSTLSELRAAQADRDRVQLAMDHATEHERARIATELHDDTIQVMTAASLKLDVARARQGDGEQLEQALDLMQKAIARARRLSFDLYPPSLDDGLAPALCEIAARLEADGAFSVSAVASAQRYPADVERLVYRTAKELLENARRHSHAQAVSVSVRPAGEAVVLEVVDDGLGFDPAQAAADGEFHFGLRAADERVRRAGGTLVLDSTPGHGTRAMMRLPVRLEPRPDGGRLLRSERPMEPPA